MSLLQRAHRMSWEPALLMTAPAIILGRPGGILAEGGRRHRLLFVPTTIVTTTSSNFSSCAARARRLGWRQARHVGPSSWRRYCRRRRALSSFAACPSSRRHHVVGMCFLSMRTGSMHAPGFWRPAWPRGAFFISTSRGDGEIFSMMRN